TSSGATGGGNTITLTGTNLPALAQVLVGGFPVDDWVIDSNTQITLTMPPHAAGSVYVTAISPFGTSSTGSGSQYTYNNTTPAVTALDVSQGPTAGGYSVTITGTNLFGATVVAFGGTNATSFSVLNGTTILAVAPALSAGPVDVRVTSAGGTSSVVSADQYTAVAAPTVT